MGLGYPIHPTLASQKGLTGGAASAILRQMSENNHKEWAPGLVALHTIGDHDLALRTEKNTREYVAYLGRWRANIPDVGWEDVEEVWGEAVWMGSREAFLRMRDDSKTPADLLRMARENAQSPGVDPTVVIFGEEYVKASDSRAALAQAETTIEAFRQEARRACTAAERFGIYQSRADVAAGSLASKLVDLRAEFEAYKRRTADSRLQVQREKVAMNDLQGERDQYRDDFDAIRSVLGELGGSVDLCVDKIRAYQEDLRNAEESSSTWCDRFNNEREQMDRIRAALGERFSRESTAGMVAEIDRLREVIRALEALREGERRSRTYEITLPACTVQILG